MSFHTRIKNRRTALFSSHEAFVHELETTYDLKVSWQAVQQWEKEGGTAPNRSRMPVVAQALKTTPEWLLYGTGVEVVGEQEPSPKVVRSAQVSAPPKWMDAEAYRLLDLYYASGIDERRQIMAYAEQLSPAAESVISNQG